MRGREGGRKTGGDPERDKLRIRMRGLTDSSTHTNRAAVFYVMLLPEYVMNMHGSVYLDIDAQI